MRRALLIFALILASTGSAHAVTLSTPPFPGFDINTGTARCVISNDGKKVVRDVKIEMLNASGAVNPDGSTLADLGVGLTTGGGGVFMNGAFAVRCRFTVPSKQNLRASFTWIPVTSGGTPVVIPAQ